MDEIFCVPCEVAFGSKEISLGGVRRLGTFKGYTVDFRLKQFRRVSPYLEEPSIEFIDFSSRKGQELQVLMHAEATR